MIYRCEENSVLYYGLEVGENIRFREIRNEDIKQEYKSRLWELKQWLKKR